MAISWENNILGFIPKKDWLDIPFNPVRQGDPTDILFDDESTDNLVASWESLASEYQIPVMAQFHGFDTEAQTTFRVPVDNHNIEKGLIKVKINQSERLRSLLRAGVQNDDMYDYVIRDGVRLGEQVITRTKVAKNELLATGAITIKENNLNITVDYGVEADQKSFQLDLSTTSDLSGQIREILDAALEKGVTITGIFTSRKNITKMRRNEGLQKEINGNVGIGAMIRSTDFTAYMQEEFGITQIITNDLRYGVEDGIDVNGRPRVKMYKYFPEDKVTFFASNPNNRLGRGLFAPPPEVDSLSSIVSASEQSPYVYVSQWTENDPAVLWTKASTLYMPVLFNPSSLWIATVTETEAEETEAEG